MRYLITTIGSSGDINPFVAVGCALRERGHEVLLAVNPHFEARIRAAGLGFHPLGKEEEFLGLLKNPRLVNPMTAPLFVMRQLVATSVRPTVETMERLVADFKPDVVFRHHISFGARWVCERHGVPSATGILSPMSWFSRARPSIYHALPIRQPGWMGRLSLRVGEITMRGIFDRPMEKMARELGFPPGRCTIAGEAFDADLTLALWSSHFRPAAADDPAHGRVCGFPWFDRQGTGEHAPAEIERFLNEDPGDAPIIFTLGTSVVHHAGRFYHNAAEACRVLGRRGLLLTGRPEYAPAAHTLPAGVRAFTYAPFSTVLPRGAATVLHGGIGTVAQSLRAGRPGVIIPFANDQFDNAEHARRLGVTVTARPQLLSAGRLARTLGRILDDAPMAARARELGAKLAAEDGARVAADELERLAGRRSQPPAAAAVAAPVS